MFPLPLMSTHHVLQSSWTAEFRDWTQLLILVNLISTGERGDQYIIHRSYLASQIIQTRFIDPMMYLIVQPLAISLF